MEEPTILLMEAEKEDNKPTIIKYIDDRTLNQNKSFVIIFVGQTGSGKSYSALRLAEMIDPDFTMDNVCFTALSFMRKINELNDKKDKGEEIKGRVVMWDEFGIEHNSREAMTKRNRVIHAFFETSRNLNLCVIMTVPMLSFIDSATRKLIHGVAEMIGISKRDKTATVKIKMIQANVWTGKEYPKYLRYKKEGKQRVTKMMKFGLPSPKIIELYERHKHNYTTNLNKEIMMDLERDEEKNKPKELKPIKLTDIQAKVLELLKTKNLREVAEELNKDISTIHATKEQLEKKGLTFDQIRVGMTAHGYKIGNLDRIITKTKEDD